MSAKSSLSAAENEVAIALMGRLRSPLPAPVPLTASQSTLVHELRILAGGAGSKSPARRIALRSSVSEKVAAFFYEERLRPKALGSTPQEVVEIFVNTVEGSQDVIHNLPRRSNLPVGREGIFNGRLFQRLLLNHGELQTELRRLAENELDELNELIHTGSQGPITDLDGRRLTPQGDFKTLVIATDFWLKKPNDSRWYEFIDGAYVSRITLPSRAPGQHWTMPLSLEIKRPYAAADFPRQHGEMLARFTEAETIRMTVPGSAIPTDVPTRDFVFSTNNRLLVGATRNLKGTAEYDFVGTSSGGYSEAFLEIGLRLDTGPIDRLSMLLFRGRIL